MAGLETTGVVVAPSPLVSPARRHAAEPEIRLPRGETKYIPPPQQQLSSSPPRRRAPAARLAASNRRVPLCRCEGRVRRASCGADPNKSQPWRSGVHLRGVRACCSGSRSGVDRAFRRRFGSCCGVVEEPSKFATDALINVLLGGGLIASFFPFPFTRRSCLLACLIMSLLLPQFSFLFCCCWLASARFSCFLLTLCDCFFLICFALAAARSDCLRCEDEGSFQFHGRAGDIFAIPARPLSQSVVRPLSIPVPLFRP